MRPTRTVHCEDAIAWIHKNPPMPGTSLVSSLPDYSEFKSWPLERWKAWFVETAHLLLSSCPSNDVAIFYQSDIKYNGEWVDKAYLCQRAAELAGSALLWHKIVRHTAAGVLTFGRPSYSHLLCFSKSLRLRDFKKSRADILESGGLKTWQRGMGADSCREVAHFIANETQSHTLLNPFCGEGSVLAAANAAGLNAIGIERHAKRAERAGRQTLQGDRWSAAPNPT